MKAYICGIIASMTVACSDIDTLSENKARSVSDKFIADRYSVGDSSILSVTANETAANWTFVYDTPDENWTGGPLSITVDKKSGEVIDHLGYQ